MPLQNRVTPFGEIIATPARGTMMGNRGVLHDETKRLGTARWRHANWVNCVLSFHGRRRTIMTPDRYTELFFLDEAVALAAGHRPCGECRRANYRAYMDLWAQVCNDLGPATPKAVDRALHHARIDLKSRQQRRFQTDLATLPDGAFVAVNGQALLVWGEELRPYDPSGYGPARPRPDHAKVIVLTPEPTIRILRSGYRPDIWVKPAAG
jgi:hypothetical protein